MIILKIVHSKTTSHSKHFPYSKKKGLLGRLFDETKPVIDWLLTNRHKFLQQAQLTLIFYCWI